MAQQQAILGTMADPRGARGRYGTYADVLPEAWQDYLLLETAASRILAYEAQRIPALLQTPDLRTEHWPRPIRVWRTMTRGTGPSRRC